MARTLEEVNEILHSAKLTEEDIAPTSQAIFFSPRSAESDNFRLLELNPILLKAIEENESLYIKGDDDDEVVICTESSTFHVCETETSNNLLLVKPIEHFSDMAEGCERGIKTVNVQGIFQAYLEVNIGTPHLKKLNDLLKDTVYKGPEFEFQIQDKKLYTLEELKTLVQASNQELTEALSSMDVAEINGHIRLLDFEYHFRVLSYMLKLIDENSWNLDSIDYNETCEALQDLVSSEVIKGIFEKYTEESRMIDGEQLYRYKETDVCRFFARVLLNEAGRFNLGEFLQAWKDSVPEGMIPEEEMLYGVAIVNRKSYPHVVWAFEESDLPDDISERFRVLFEAKDKWTVPEITPYIRRLATKVLDVNALLAKHARASKVDGVKYYSAKHAK